MSSVEVSAQTINSIFMHMKRYEVVLHLIDHLLRLLPVLGHRYHVVHSKIGLHRSLHSRWITILFEGFLFSFWFRFWCRCPHRSKQLVAQVPQSIDHPMAGKGDHDRHKEHQGNVEGVQVVGVLSNDVGVQVDVVGLAVGVEHHGDHRCHGTLWFLDCIHLSILLPFLRCFLLRSLEGEVALQFHQMGPQSIARSWEALSFVRPSAYCRSLEVHKVFPIQQFSLSWVTRTSIAVLLSVPLVA